MVIETNNNIRLKIFKIFNFFFFIIEICLNFYIGNDYIFTVFMPNLTIVY